MISKKRSRARRPPRRDAAASSRLLADVRDESAEDIRMVLEPRSRSVDPDVLMGMLFRNSDLEVRFSMNMNVLIDGVTPKVCSLKEMLRAFLDFRREVLCRRSAHRMSRSYRALRRVAPGAASRVLSHIALQMTRRAYIPKLKSNTVAAAS